MLYFFLHLLYMKKSKVINIEDESLSESEDEIKINPSAALPSL